ncbi:hypothetical protein F7230_06510 [Corynebacterium sp. 320]|uniref:hypothetical protein n=1 Tax=Corynebacterium TaxID=1716 RepID=UPI00125CCBC3|nr:MULTISPECIES: hypothetical protein [Corynebacterium]KAB1503182.1 hypothetical protein F7230_06510 [Corynebacterium sp. 320]KAB1550605.1 hypothetical protein F7233_08675 [Corynebacterium sp. 321]KAB1550966.1 hypothetical protein F7232_07855 [Corynebacterium sp. 319]KAB3526979.1 hypothetical protein F8354_06510 [Corynebacterium sp. 250]KAB3538471.1 hypothetical protein F8390_09410 [Corynebacterium sp. 366]
MITKTFELGPESALNDVRTKLSSLPGYKVKDSGKSHLTVHVGHPLKYRMMGVYVTDNYLAPIEVQAEKADDGAISVTLKQSIKALFNLGGKNVEFYQRGYSRVEEALSAKR